MSNCSCPKCIIDNKYNDNVNFEFHYPSTFSPSIQLSEKAMKNFLKRQENYQGKCPICGSTGLSVMNCRDSPLQCSKNYKHPTWNPRKKY